MNDECPLAQSVKSADGEGMTPRWRHSLGDGDGPKETKEFEKGDAAQRVANGI